MKKINLVFLSRVFENSIRGPILFTLLFLIGFGINTVSAQYVSTDIATKRLQDVSRDITLNWEALHNSGDEANIKRAELKLGVVSRMLTDLKEGATVKGVVEKYIIFPNTMIVKDFQIGDDPKNGHNTGWLKDEILKMLKS